MARTDTTDREDALIRLKRNIQPDAQPALLDDEVEALLDEHKLATFWTASAAYLVGDVVIPLTRNGRRYRCIKAGTSGTTEPNWPTTENAKIGDGTGTLQWQEDGLEYKNIFDIRAASYAGCLLHQAKAAPLHDIRSNLTDYSQSQVYEHWGDVAKRFAPARVA